VQDLEKIVCAVNHTDVNYEGIQQFEKKDRGYGKNPTGVGISSLNYCPAASFGTLQSETEDKVKFYGCLCWSEKTIPNQDFLDNKLCCGLPLTDKMSKNSDELMKSIYPLRIHQLTPLRVLHRRSAAVREKLILSVTSQRIDDHWFRLHLSTSAGTCEFSAVVFFLFFLIIANFLMIIIY